MNKVLQLVIGLLLFVGGLVMLVFAGKIGSKRLYVSPNEAEYKKLGEQNIILIVFGIVLFVVGIFMAFYPIIDLMSDILKKK